MPRHGCCPCLLPLRGTSRVLLSTRVQLASNTEDGRTTYVVLLSPLAEHKFAPRLRAFPSQYTSHLNLCSDYPDSEMGADTSPAGVIAAGAIFPPLCTALLAARFVCRKRTKARLLTDDWLLVPAVVCFSEQR